MRETSDIMQNLASSYGERQTMDYCISVLRNQIKCPHNKKIMALVFRLFGTECIFRDLSFYMIQGVVSREAVT